MASRSQPYRIEHPLTPEQIEAIDEMFQILFDDLATGAFLPFEEEGDMVYAGEEPAVLPTRLPIGDANTVIRTDGVIPEWGKVQLDADVEDTLPVANGGTGATSFTPYAVILGGTIATGPLQDVGDLGTAGDILTSAGAAAKPTWETPTPVDEVGYWSPLTNGDATNPELIFVDGDTIAVWTDF